MSDSEDDYEERYKMIWGGVSVHYYIAPHFDILFHFTTCIERSAKGRIHNELGMITVAENLIRLRQINHPAKSSPHTLYRTPLPDHVRMEIERKDREDAAQYGDWDDPSPSGQKKDSGYVTPSGTAANAESGTTSSATAKSDHAPPPPSTAIRTNIKIMAGPDLFDPKKEALVLFPSIIREKQELPLAATTTTSKTPAEKPTKSEWDKVDDDDEPDDAEDEDMSKRFQKRMETLTLSKQGKRVAKRELKSLGELTDSKEITDVARYLDWLTSYPWGKQTTDNFSMANARSVLDSAHFGLTEIKQRILEFIAVGRLTGTLTTKSLCLVGPAGVGKTSIAATIAQALGRKFHRMDFGGVKDAAELWGHHRTYRNSLPGRFIHILRDLGTENPVILLDEIDKIAEPQVASALLAVLEPSQCKSFVDHYLEVSVDLSKVLFVCTANSLDPLPSVLRDRMEVLTLKGYSEMEKVVIARDYMVKEIGEKYGLRDHGFAIDENVLARIVRGYCPEPGLRNLKRVLEKIAGKVAVKLCEFQEANPGQFLNPSAVVEVKKKRSRWDDTPPRVVAMEVDSDAPTAETATSTVDNQNSAVALEAGLLNQMIEEPLDTTLNDRKQLVPDFMRVTSKDVAQYLGARHPLARSFSEETVVD